MIPQISSTSVYLTRVLVDHYQIVYDDINCKNTRIKGRSTIGNKDNNKLKNYHNQTSVRIGIRDSFVAPFPTNFWVMQPAPD